MTPDQQKIDELERSLKAQQEINELLTEERRYLIERLDKAVDLKGALAHFTSRIDGSLDELLSQWIEHTFKSLSERKAGPIGSTKCSNINTASIGATQPPDVAKCDHGAAIKGDGNVFIGKPPAPCTASEEQSEAAYWKEQYEKEREMYHKAAKDAETYYDLLRKIALSMGQLGRDASKVLHHLPEMVARTLRNQGYADEEIIKWKTECRRLDSLQVSNSICIKELETQLDAARARAVQEHEQLVELRKRVRQINEDGL